MGKFNLEAWIKSRKRYVATEPGESSFFVSADDLRELFEGKVLIDASDCRAELAGREGMVMDEDEKLRRLTAALREADARYEQCGGSTRHHVRDCLLPALGDHGLVLTAPPASQEGGE